MMLNYDIVMQTPVGKKFGKIQLVINQATVTGSMSILGKTEPLNGTIEQNGSCKLHGRIISLVKTFDYIAYGHIDDKGINLKLQRIGKQEVLTIAGTPCLMD